MIQTSQISKRISELLSAAGVKDKEVIDEMTDHYMTEIEERIENGNSELHTIREVYQEIAQTNFDYLIPKKKSYKRFFFISFIVLAAFTAFQIFNCPEEKTSYTETCSTPNPPSGWPLASAFQDISSGFGMRVHPVKKVKMLHKGIDIKASIGTEVFSTGEGQVLKTGYSVRSGNYIVIKHNARYTSKYKGLSEIGVKEKQTVKEGALIGLVGMSGMSLGPHLHYEVLDNELVVDPQKLSKP